MLHGTNGTLRGWLQARDAGGGVGLRDSEGKAMTDIWKLIVVFFVVFSVYNAFRPRSEPPPDWTSDFVVSGGVGEDISSRCTCSAAYPALYADTGLNEIQCGGCEMVPCNELAPASIADGVWDVALTNQEVCRICSCGS